MPFEPSFARGAPGSAGVPPAWTIVGLRPTAGGTPALPGTQPAVPHMPRRRSLASTPTAGPSAEVSRRLRSQRPPATSRRARAGAFARAPRDLAYTPPAQAPPLAGCNDCAAPSASTSAAAPAVARRFASLPTSPTRVSSPRSSNTSPLLMPAPASLGHLLDPELRRASPHLLKHTLLRDDGARLRNPRVRFRPLALSVFIPPAVRLGPRHSLLDRCPNSPGDSTHRAVLLLHSRSPVCFDYSRDSRLEPSEA